MSFDEIRVLDLFAGSGALGLEALSRGAAHVTFVDNDTQAIRTISHNAEALGVGENCTILQLDVPGHLKRYAGAPFDLILADPPYQFVSTENVVSKALDLLLDDGFLALEHGYSSDFSALEDRVSCSRKYGRTFVTIFD